MSIDKAIVILAEDSFLPITKEAKKLNQKAKVRNRGDVCCPSDSPNVLDDKDHFPINNINQARNALARASQYDGKKPSWWKGSLKSLQNTIKRKVHSKYPSIEINK